MLERVLLLLIRCGRIIPPTLAWRLGAELGEIFGALPMRDQKRAFHHLAVAFPERGRAWQRRTAVAAFRSIGGMALWTLSTMHRSPRRLVDDLAWEGREHFIATRDAAARGEGTLICSGHLGNWELLARTTGALVPVTVLGKRMRNPAVDALVRHLREGTGNRMVYQDQDLRVSLRELRSGRLMATLPDQDIPRLAGCFVPWFGRLAYTPVGPAGIARLGRACVQPVYCFRRAGRWVHHWGPRFALPRGGDRERNLALLMARVMAYQEAVVRRHPEQWVWWHKRWRTQPEDRPDAVCLPHGVDTPEASV